MSGSERSGEALIAERSGEVTCAAGVTDIFRRVLQNEEVASSSDFFMLGGDSLLATRVLSAIARQYGAELSFEDFVSAPSPEALSKKIVSVMH